MHLQVIDSNDEKSGRPRERRHDERISDVKNFTLFPARATLNVPETPVRPR
jgi:hypothetical protein